MSAQKSVNQLDPFDNDKDNYRTSEIRHSRSRFLKNPFINLIDPKNKKGRRNFIIITCIFLAVIIGSVFIILRSQSEPTNTPTEDSPLVNPTGHEASSEYTIDRLNDPELRAGEQSKLNSVFTLISEKDWEYARALFNTIFPDYLDDCGKYDYYRAAVTLADNIANFAISHELATERMEALAKTCNYSAEE